ncbi:MAG: HD domain-containing protein [Gammaproteobacteria bacterium]|nr:HD domain-containing protein [Gammaproteobacteria bacterium]
MSGKPRLRNSTVRWYQLLKYQIPLAVLILFSLLAGAITYTLSSVNARKHDYAILNLAGQLRVIATGIITQSQQYKTNAPRDYATYNRDLKLYAKSLDDQTSRYDEIIHAFKERELGPELTGLKSGLSCNWDEQSISQLQLTVDEWENFQSGLAQSYGNNLTAPRLEYAAEFILKNAESFTHSTSLLAQAFRDMMQRKLEKLTLIIKGLLIFSGLIACGILALLYFRLLSPLKTSLRGIHYISNGYLQHRIHNKTHNELSLLDDAINNMSSSLNAIFNLTSHVASSATIDETLEIVFNEFNNISPINWTGIFHVDAGRSTIKLSRLFSHKKSTLEENQSFDFKGSFMADMIDKGKIAIVNDISQISKQYPDSAIVQLLIKDQLKSALLLPLTTSFKDDSVIVFASEQINAYDESKNGLVSFIGDQLTHSFEKSVVMENLVISAIEGLAKLAESRDPETGDHLLRMSIYSSIIAQQLKDNSPYSEAINKQYIRDILRFAPMHDIGKVGIEDSILLKPGQLTEQERRQMQQHPVIGANVLRRCEAQMNQVGYSIFKMGIDIADAHHEKFDGTGYPNQLSAGNIPLAARIVAIADVFDALTSKRPYKEAWPIDKALDLLEQESGKHFDPVIIQAFKQAMPEIMNVYNQHKHV